MYCPTCRSEYRAGIVRCPTCDVPLKDAERDAPGRDRIPSPLTPVEVEQMPMVQFCGFFTLDEARAARDQLRERKIPAEILIRDAATAGAEGAHDEEFWLRVPVARIHKVEEILGFQADSEAPDSEEREEEEFACSDCGKPVKEHETFCSHCGAKFDE